MLRWAVQEGVDDGDRIAKACEDLETEVCRFSSRPFSDDLPDAPTDGLTIFYGSPRVGALVAQSGLWNPGIFGNPEDFDMAHQLEHWGLRMLNSNFIFTTLSELVEKPFLDGRTVFVRPTTDDKIFSGEVFNPNELRHWASQVIDNGSGGLPSNTQIVLSPALSIGREWRLIVVDSLVVTGSQYRENGKHSVSSIVPSEVVAFAEEAEKAWSPHAVFALDVTESDGQLRIIEANGFNGSGLYASDVTAIVKTVSDFVLKN